MARFTAGGHDSLSIRTLLRTTEVLTCALAASIAGGAWASSGWVASHWVSAETMPTATVARAVDAMGLVVALRMIESMYVSAIAGMQI